MHIIAKKNSGKIKSSWKTEESGSKWQTQKADISITFKTFLSGEIMLLNNNKWKQQIQQNAEIEKKNIESDFFMKDTTRKNLNKLLNYFSQEMYFTFYWWLICVLRNESYQKKNLKFNHCYKVEKIYLCWWVEVKAGDKKRKSFDNFPYSVINFQHLVSKIAHDCSKLQ